MPPYPSLTEHLGEVEQSQSNTLRATPVDDTESRLGGHERHVESHNRLG
jgi:hypothetical protein